MTDDLVKRLRDPAYKGQEQMRASAADRIEALEAALWRITYVQYYGMEGAAMESDEMKSIARAVLAGEEKDD